MIIKRAYELRTKKLLSISDVANALSLKEEDALRLENGSEIYPSKAFLQKLADYYHVSYEYLIGETDFTDKENISICRNLKTYLADESTNKKFIDSGFYFHSSAKDIYDETAIFTNESLAPVIKILGISVKALLSNK